MLPQKCIGTNDCFRACLASLLNKKIEDVPNVYSKSIEVMNNNITSYLKSENLSAMYMRFPCKRILTVFSEMHDILDNMYYILIGKVNGLEDHAVIACGNSIVFDPSLDDCGIDSRIENGCYEVVFLIPSYCKNGS